MRGFCECSQELALSLLATPFANNALDSTPRASQNTACLRLNKTRTTPFGIKEIVTVAEQPLVKRLILLNASGITEFASLIIHCAPGRSEVKKFSIYLPIWHYIMGELLYTEALIHLES